MTRSPGFAPPRLFAAVLVALTAACGGNARTPTAPAPRPEPAGAEQIGPAPEVPAAAPAPAAANILGTASYDLPVVANPWVETELGFLVNQRHAVIGRWLERADHYEAWVREVFAGYGLPQDLHHLAMVESGYLPTARSHAGAVGMWQFMSATGRGMGLRIDELVDERMDPVRSTHAAARHLKQLHREFGGDWALAAAAYNAGSGRINRGLGRFGVRSFWDLATVGDLATETKHYVPRLYAVTIIAKDRQRFGYTAPSGPVRRFAYDSVQVDVPTPLAELARIGGLSLDQLRALNPHLVRGMAPARYWVWTPDGTGTATQVAFQNSDYRRDGGHGTYAVRRGDDLQKLAEFTGLPVERIRELNPSVDPANLRSGQRLVLPAAAARILTARPAERVATRERDREREGGEERGETRSRNADRVADSGRSSSSSSSSAARSRNSDGEGRSESGSSNSTRSRNSDGEERTASSSSSRSRNADGEGRSESSSRSRNADGEGRSSSSASRSRNSDGEERTASSTRSRNSDGERRGEGESSTSRSRSSESEGRSSSTSRSRNSDGEERTASSSRSRAAESEGRSASSTRSRSSEGEERETRSTSSSRSGSGSRSSSSSAREHTVADGETLWSISRRFEVSIAAIRDANDLGDKPIQPGQTLRIPRASSSSSTASASSSSSRSGAGERTASVASSERKATGEGRASGSSQAAASRGRSSARSTEHVVQSGETLWSISRRFDVSVTAIREANELGDRPIQPGQTLRIPSAPSTGGSR